MAHSSIPERQRVQARALRSASTPAERKLWARLRGHRLTDLHFRRQAPFGVFVADFVCHEARVAVELDGGQHGRGLRPLRDAARDRWFAAHDYLTLRFWNSDVFESIDSVAETIYWRCVERLPDNHRLKTPSLTLPLKGGEDSVAAFAALGEVPSPLEGEG